MLILNNLVNPVNDSLHCRAFTGTKVISQSRVAVELALITLRCGKPDTELPRSLASPATRLHFLLRAPRQIQQTSNTLVRIIKLRVHSFPDNQPLQPADVFVRNECLFTPETREIKTRRVHTPRKRICSSVKIDHCFISKELARIENLFLRLARHALFDLESCFDQACR